MRSATPVVMPSSTPSTSATTIIAIARGLLQAAFDHCCSLLFNEPAPLKVQQMREHRSARRSHQPRIEAGIGVGDDVGNVARLLADEPQDLLLALHAVADQMPRTYCCGLVTGGPCAG